MSRLSFKTSALFACTILQYVWVITAHASPVFIGPVPYLSSADIPTGFYAGGAPTGLENFEDDSLDFGITASAGSIIDSVDRICCNDVDSVDADDGVIDGSGSSGRSWFQPDGSQGITFSFSSSVTAAGLVWTDSLTAPIVFEAFGPGMVSLGTTAPAVLGDGVFTGTTAEDRFFGVQDQGGIVALRLTVLTAPGASGLEVDHVQFGSAGQLPEPQTVMLLAAGLISVVLFPAKRSG